MPLSSEIIISDTSCLILLSKIDELGLLKSLGSEVYATPIIQNEFGNLLPDWVVIKSPTDLHYQKILEMDLDAGEASAIALALENKKSVLILDDLKGRKIADRLSLKYSGTFGLIVRAKQEGVIETVKPLLHKIRQTNFRFSEELFFATLAAANE